MYCRASATLAITSASRITVMTHLAISPTWSQIYQDGLRVGSESHTIAIYRRWHAAGVGGAHMGWLVRERGMGACGLWRECRDGASDGMPARTSAAFDLHRRALRHTARAGRSWSCTERIS